MPTQPSVSLESDAKQLGAAKPNVQRHRLLLSGAHVGRAAPGYDLVLVVANQQVALVHGASYHPFDAHADLAGSGGASVQAEGPP